MVAAPVTLVVGLTGNIASGKSTVAARFRENGATVIDADALARDAVARHSPALARIAERWPTVVRRDGTLDRAALRHIVFGDAEARRALDAIVHPEVARLRDEAVAAARARGDRVVVYDVPLLFEAGLEHTVDVIVVVDARADVRRARLIRERGLRGDEADAMLAAQLPADVKRARATHVIENNGTHAELMARADRVWAALARGDAPG